jgi:cobalt-zinc-cadmium efflux system membrane fusion protein
VRTWLATLGLAAVAMGGLWYLGLPPFAAPAPPPTRTGRAPVQATEQQVDLTERQVATLRIAAVGQASFVERRSAVGNIDFNQNLLVQVFTPYAGRIIATYANVGDRVEKGQVLFTIDSPDLLTATSNIISHTGQLTLANANLRRLTETLRSGGGAQKDVDQARSDQQTAEGNVRADRYSLRIFGKTDEEIDTIVHDHKADPVLIVRSPITGLVTQRTAAPGLYVQPGNAPAPFTVADTATMWMLANVVEADAPFMRVGQPIEVTVGAWPGRVFDGVITVVGAQVDPATRRLMIRSEVKDPEARLRAGMFANFTIRIAEPFQATAVPNTAIVREGDGSMAVWVTTDRKHFDKRLVRTGMQQNGMTQILEGLQPGQLVVTEGAVFISNKAAGGDGAE